MPIFRKLRVESLEARQLLASYGGWQWHPRSPRDETAAVAAQVAGEQVAASESVENSASPLAATTRDAALHPFAANSPWNLGVGSGAQLATISGGFRSSGANLNVNSWSIPIYFAKDTDRLVAIYWGGGLQGSVRIPAGAQPDSQGDASMAVISPDRQSVAEFIGMRWTNDNRIDADVAVVNSLTDQGVYPSYHGARAYGGSQIAGLIRKDEWTSASIPHALAVAVDPTSLNRNAPGGKTFVWPANSSDGGNGSGYGSDGNLFMGSYLAIPRSVNIAALGLSPQALAVARALQDYGAYVVDRGGGNIIYYAEPGSSVSTSASELGRLSQYLRVVTNNSAANVNGGGARFVEPAPPFAPAGGGTTPQPQTYTISGSVSNSVAPIPARVELFTPAGVLVAGQTTSSGLYSLVGVAAGNYELSVSSPSYQSATRAISVDGPEVADFELEIAAPFSQTVSGRVTSASGANLSGATVRLLKSGMLFAGAASDAQGRYALADIPAGTYTIEVARAGYQTASRTTTVTTFQPTVENFSLSAVSAQAFSIGGTLRNSRDRNVANERVYLFIPDTDTVVQMVRTDSRGRYTFKDVPPGTYAVASDGGYGSRYWTDRLVSVVDSDWNDVSLVINLGRRRR